MKSTLIVRSIREGTLQLKRNAFLSATTIGLGALILFLLNAVFAVEFYTQTLLKDLESRADFIVPLAENHPLFELESLKNDLKNKYHLHIQTREAEIIDMFEIPKRLHIKFDKLEEVENVFETLKSLRYQEVVGDWDSDIERDFVQMVARLLQVQSGIKKASSGLVIIFMVGGVLLVLNTFRLMLFARKEEIFIARLVGGDTSFIAGPFLWEGFLLGISSCIISLFVFVFVLREIDFLPRGEVFLHLWNNLFVWQILAASLIGILGSWLAIKQYLMGSLQHE